MAAKFHNPLADDAHDLNTPIGCMTSIFHIFDRHNALSTRRITLKPDPPPSRPSLVSADTVAGAGARRYSLDLRDVVKDSMNRDSGSPRKTNPADIKESLRVLAKLREASSSPGAWGDAPRYSCENPRVEREKMLTRSHSANNRSADLRWGESPSVVAKLMGLEPLPVAKDEVTRVKHGRKVVKVAVETAPWNSPSVYSEIEKRLKDLEFKQPGKDLRALKQILEAMQAKGLLDCSKKEEPKTTPFEPPIVIMKPAKLVNKAPKNAPPLKPKPTTSSPRQQQQRKLPLEKRTRPQTPDVGKQAAATSPVPKRNTRLRKRINEDQASQTSDVSVSDAIQNPMGEEVPTENPSPVSVLDSSLYRDELDMWKSRKDGQRESKKGFEVGNRKNLRDVEDLVRKLERLNTTHDETSTDYIASLCEKQDSDHRYISEILLASGLLLRDLSCGYTPINPELFIVLEQTKSCKSRCVGPVRSDRSLERVHRKLIFDSVSEMVMKKSGAAEGSWDPWGKKGAWNAQSLLRELCEEVDEMKGRRIGGEEEELKSILSEDVVYRGESWKEWKVDLSRIVLEIERSMFKEMVDEVLALMGLRHKTGRRRLLSAVS